MVGPIYFPILRAKAGEIDGIGRLSPTAQNLTCPLLDFPRQKPSDVRPLPHYLGEKLHEIKKSWGTSSNIYLDFSRYEPDIELPDGRHIVDYVFDICRQCHLKSVPVVAPLSLRGPGTLYFEAVSRVIKRDKRGMALRLPYEDFIKTAKLKSILLETVNLVSALPQNVDVYLDAESVTRVPLESSSEVDFVSALRTAAVVTLSFGYRQIIFAASNIPDSITRHEKGIVMRVPRVEFRAWRNLVQNPALSSLRFGDYGVIHPGQVESNAGVIPPSRIRVTTEDEYILYKGDRNEIRSVSRRVVGDGILNSCVNSWGANAVRECAAGYGNEGNATNWVARDTNMHIENTVAAMFRYVTPQVTPLTTSAATGPWLQSSLEFSDDV